MASIFHFVMFALLITHELDAVKRHEWRTLPIISFLEEEIGEQVFIWIHVPLFVGLLHFGALESTTILAEKLSAFAIIHVALHWMFRNHPKNEFNDFSSWALIIGAGLFGAAHLLAI